MKKMLIVYYSWSNGNTKRIAEQLQAATGADIMRIKTVQPYQGSHNDVVRQGQDEVEAGYEPPIRPMPYDVQDYDIIAVGTPTWWYTMAPPVKTFLNSNSWYGKTVIPFMTNGGWPGSVLRDMRAACRGASFAQEREFRFDSTGGPNLVTPQSAIDTWTDEVRALL
jgi:hypothetical protein